MWARVIPCLVNDSIGLLTARVLRERLKIHDGVCIVECPLALENCIDKLRLLGRTVVIVDSAVGIKPGDVAVIRSEMLQSWLPSTHLLPPLLIEKLAGKNVYWILIGVREITCLDPCHH